MRLNSHPSGRHFLQIPGPTNVPDRVLRAMDAIRDRHGEDAVRLSPDAKTVVGGVEGFLRRSPWRGTSRIRRARRDPAKLHRQTPCTSSC